MRALGLALVFAVAGCGEPDHEHGHGHEHHAHTSNYGGDLVELGDHEFQVDLLLDGEAGKLTAYLFDGHAERAVPAAMESFTIHAQLGGEEVAIEMKRVANPLVGIDDGKSSQYAGGSEKLKGLETFDGRIASITLAGKTFTDVAFHYEPDHAHDHEH